LVRNLTVNNKTDFPVSKPEIHGLVHKLKKDLHFKLESVAINFLTGEEILPINKKYLNHNFSTDIITFNYSGENYTLDGEIFISLDDASFFADKYKVELRNEVLRLIIHGFLHLVGYDDNTATEKRKMKRIENKLVNKYSNSLTKITDII
jgi:rRNA maturation RNase YbeY